MDWEFGFDKFLLDLLFVLKSLYDISGNKHNFIF